MKIMGHHENSHLSFASHDGQMRIGLKKEEINFQAENFFSKETTIASVTGER